MSKVVLDASALLAFLNGEPGGDLVPADTGEAVISTVNLAEVISVLTKRGVAESEIRRRLRQLALDVLDFDRSIAERTGLMIASTQTHGLSLGDRACLATSLSQRLPVMTCDRSWSNVAVGASVQVLR
jgi:PIN domain nuclease of toxin-antitoxin system